MDHWAMFCYNSTTNTWEVTAETTDIISAKMAVISAEPSEDETYYAINLDSIRNAHLNTEQDVEIEIIQEAASD